MSFPANLNILDILRQNKASSYVWVAVATLLWCDTLSNVSEEAKHIWSSKASAPKFLYLFIRYWSLFVITVDAVAFGTIQLSLTRFILMSSSCYSMINMINRRCRLFWWFTVTLGGGYLFAILVNIILALRIHAMFNQNIHVTRCLIFLNTVYITSQTYNTIVVGIALSKTAYIASKKGLPLRGCVNTPMASSQTLPPWICVMVVAGSYLLLTIVACYQSWAEGRRQLNPAISGGRARIFSPLMVVLVRDGAAYCIFTTVLTIVATMFSIFKPQLLGIARPIQFGLYVCFGCRLIINVRQAAYVEAPRSTFSLGAFEFGSIGAMFGHQGSQSQSTQVA